MGRWLEEWKEVDIAMCYRMVVWSNSALSEEDYRCCETVEECVSDVTSCVSLMGSVGKDMCLSYTVKGVVAS